MKPEALAHAIRRSCEIKAGIVGEDAREAGRRALLNLGHTFAHALEAETGYSDTLLHGEAVALGCVLAMEFSALRGLCPAEDAERTRKQLSLDLMLKAVDERGFEAADRGADHR